MASKQSGESAQGRAEWSPKHKQKDARARERGAMSSEPSRHAGEQADAAVLAEHRPSADEREPVPRGWLEKPRGPLYTWIVHFDAERSTGPSEAADGA
ncbi:hypothetical protein [Paraburkholderia antibiotica]|uniref:Uncharacterized protein n=1 Tax=Paraburkholderia antibiotica TaxID=2728839 RepID=A0A7Y0A2N1_9BURK|nr:hypothetical protein [Paraburkholderia antibiotica]NML35339.1 hypothetical protein [Paraburkholderia antibiotica]